MYMAMPSGNVVIPDKMQFSNGGAVGPAGGGAAGSGIGWYPDERDAFISWLRGEFAAANAIIDSLCHHLKSVGGLGEYDGVIGSIQQRRCNWNSVLHMQQYFSVAEVLNALQQVTWRRQQQHQHRGGGFFDPVKVVGAGKDYKRSGGVGSRQGQGHRVEIAVKDVHNSTVEFNSPQNVANGSGNLVGNEVPKSNDKDVALAKYSDGISTKTQVDSNGKNLDSQSALSKSLESAEKELEDNLNSKGCNKAHLEMDSSSMHPPQQNILALAKTFVGTETLDGKAVNMVDGMKMYEELVDDSGVKKMVSLVNDLRAAGRQGQFQGQTFIVSKRPMKGHGREMIQFGLPIVDAPFDDEAISGTSKDPKVEPIPSLFQEFIERLLAMQILTSKPDSCIIDIYNEGDHSQPHMWPQWFGRPVCVLFLTECDMAFGRVLVTDHPGDYRGSIRLSLAPGSMLVMEGKSADCAKHAIPSIQKQRILVTLTKSQPKRTVLSDGQRSPSTPVAPPPSHWGPRPRSPSHIPNAMGPKNYVQGPTTGVLLAPAPTVPPPNSIFVPTAVAPPMAFSATPMGPAGWATGPPLRQHAPPRLPAPGTGVFLPPGTSMEPSTPEKENGAGKHADENSTSPKGAVQQDDDCREDNGKMTVTAEKESER